MVLKRRQWGETTDHLNPLTKSKQIIQGVNNFLTSQELIIQFGGRWWFGINMHMGRIQESKTSTQSSTSTPAQDEFKKIPTFTCPFHQSSLDQIYRSLQIQHLPMFLSLFLLRFQISTESCTPQTVQLPTFQYSSVV